MDLKKITGATFFGLAVVACLAIMSSHQTEDIKYFGDSLSPDSFAGEEQDSSYSGEDGASHLFDSMDAGEDEDSSSDGVEALSGISDIDTSEDEEDDDTSRSGGLEDLYSNLDSSAATTALPETSIPEESSSNDALDDGDEVTVQYTLRLADGTEVYRQQGDGDGGQFTFKLGGGHVIPGFDSAVSGMSVGESMNDVSVPADEAYGSKGFEGMGIPPNSDLVYDLKVVSKN